MFSSSGQPDAHASRDFTRHQVCEEGSTSKAKKETLQISKSKTASLAALRVVVQHKELRLPPWLIPLGIAQSTQLSHNDKAATAIVVGRRLVHVLLVFTQQKTLAACRHHVSTGLRHTWFLLAAPEGRGRATKSERMLSVSWGCQWNRGLRSLHIIRRHRNTYTHNLPSRGTVDGAAAPQSAAPMANTASPSQRGEEEEPLQTGITIVNTSSSFSQE